MFKFDKYCNHNLIITICMLSHVIYIFQPLDVGIFLFFKKTYGKHLESHIKWNVNSIDKFDFVDLYQLIYINIFIILNIQNPFAVTGYALYELHYILEKLQFIYK